ncbi:type III pantothenate kinase [Ferrovum sp. PN-J185]|uniref:type III pantothenate kinase n=1 Tax=Ferrovum sp. PN-J185 TaxID=1356306 RepID=UPI001E61D117|nr:type III pantothenate kinase [Ferrovum sp. PN-J185]MCC6068825.1 type III pantothenate kinase [Ferrovum sp. PN-J185]
MKLALDIGNTRIKWGLREKNTWLKQGDLLTENSHDLLHALIQTHSPQAVHLANVSHHDLTLLLTNISQQLSVPIQVLTGESALPPLVNLYYHPKQLGVDRWLSLFAARQFMTGPILVVNSGTATTIDALDSHNQFLGGVIIPGITMMEQALNLGTANINASQGHNVAWPRNSADALTRGAIEATIGAIKERYNEFRELVGLSTVTLVISGGNRSLLSSHLSLPHHVVDNLTLEGLGFHIDMCDSH